MGWLDSSTDSADVNPSKLQKVVEDRGAWPAEVHEVTRSCTQPSDLALTTWSRKGMGWREKVSEERREEEKKKKQQREKGEEEHRRKREGEERKEGREGEGDAGRQGAARSAVHNCDRTSPCFTLKSPHIGVSIEHLSFSDLFH